MPVLIVLTLLAALTLVWGTNWPLFRVALAELPVFTFRTIVLVSAIASLGVILKLRGESIAVPRDVFTVIKRNGNEQTVDVRKIHTRIHKLVHSGDAVLHNVSVDAVVAAVVQGMKNRCTTAELDSLASEIAAVLARPDIKQRFLAAGGSLLHSTPAEAKGTATSASSPKVPTAPTPPAP